MENEKKSFEGLGIAPKLLEILTKMEFTTPTPIQYQSIPTALEGKDVVGVAQTGTGKTLAFGIPTMQHIAAKGGRGLIILPTRELALQVEESLRKIGMQFMGLRTAVLIGGEGFGKQALQLRKNPNIIIATPGRLIDHMTQRTVKLSDVSILVLDEADRMFDMGFAPQINKILAAVNKNRQTMLFSATMPQRIVDIATHHMKLPVRVEVTPPGTTAKNVTQELFFVSKEAKIHLLENLLHEYKGSVLVFTRTKFTAKRVAEQLRRIGFTATEIHSNRSLGQRKEALLGFKTGKYRVMVATDIAARGIDVQGIELVVQFDLPEQIEDYVHRIGRTGRASMKGHAVSFATPDQGRDVKQIERLIKSQMPISKVPEKVIERAGEPKLNMGGPLERDRAPRGRYNHRSMKFRGGNRGGSRGGGRGGFGGGHDGGGNVGYGANHAGENRGGFSGNRGGYGQPRAPRAAGAPNFRGGADRPRRFYGNPREKRII